jgi:hypothetical protein
MVWIEQLSDPLYTDLPVCLRMGIHIASLLMCSSYYDLTYTEKHSYTRSVGVVGAFVIRTLWVYPYRSVCVIRSPCFMPFCLNVPCQDTPIRNLHLRIFGVTPFRWLRSITLTVTIRYFYENIICDLRVFYLRPICRNTTRA